MSDESDEATRIRRAADLAGDRLHRLHAAAAERHRGPEAWARWQAAARDFREALGLLYPRAFWEGLDRLKSGDPDAIEPAITFLEADPWAFRSGYVKEVILESLLRAALTDEHAKRLRAVVLRAVDGRDRREFRRYCGLARRVVDDDLRVALLERTGSSDRGQARRAQWVLDALREPLEPRQGRRHSARRSAR